MKRKCRNESKYDKSFAVIIVHFSACRRTALMAHLFEWYDWRVGAVNGDTCTSWNYKIHLDRGKHIVTVLRVSKKYNKLFSSICINFYFLQLNDRGSPVKIYTIQYSKNYYKFGVFFESRIKKKKRRFLS